MRNYHAEWIVVTGAPYSHHYIGGLHGYLSPEGRGIIGILRLNQTYCDADLPNLSQFSVVLSRLSFAFSLDQEFRKTLRVGCPKVIVGIYGRHSYMAGFSL